MSQFKPRLVLATAAAIACAPVSASGSRHEIEFMVDSWPSAVPYCRIEWAPHQTAYAWEVLLDSDGRADTGQNGFDHWFFLGDQNSCSEYGAYEQPLEQTQRIIYRHVPGTGSWTGVLNGGEIGLTFPTPWTAFLVRCAQGDERSIADVEEDDSDPICAIRRTTVPRRHPAGADAA